MVLVITNGKMERGQKEASGAYLQGTKRGQKEAHGHICKGQKKKLDHIILAQEHANLFCITLILSDVSEETISLLRSGL